MTADVFSPEWESALLSRVPADSDHVLLAEAVAAARSGAHRLAVIGAWLGVAESLKRRFTELSQVDSEAGKIVSRIRELEEGQRSIDRYLLTQGHEYGMTTVAEHNALEHLMGGRNLFAHPYSEQPTEEDTRAAIVSAVEHFLEKPLLLRDRFVDDEVLRILTREGWIGDSIEAVNQRIDIVLRRVDPSVLPRFIPSLVRQVEPTFDDPDVWEGMLGRRIKWVITAFLHKVDSAVIESIAGEDLLSSFPRAATIVMSHETIFNESAGHLRDATIGELCVVTPGLGVHFELTMDLVRRGALTEAELKRVAESLSTADVTSLSSAGTPLHLYVDRLVALLRSYDWYKQNPAVLALHIVGPAEISQLAPARQEELGRNILQSAHGSAKESQRLLGTISADPAPWSDDFLYGLVIECLANENGRFRLKTTGFAAALTALVELPAERRLPIIERLVETVRGSTSSPWEDTEDAAHQVQSLLGAEGTELAELVIERDSMDDPPF